MVVLLQCFCFSAVHPHVRGVYSASCVNRSILFGSSPRAWGLSYMVSRSIISHPVHPHVRGVYAKDVAILKALIRFIPTCVGFMYMPRGRPLSLLRYSPTCVGFIPTRSRLPQAGPVHPLVRGVYTRKAFKKIRLSPSECRLNPQYCVLACLPVSSQILAQCCWNIPSPHHLPCLWYRSDPKAAPEFWH